jgi:hypothetical protein
MSKHPALELPIRSKLDMLSDIIHIIRHLHQGNRKLADPLIDDLKLRSLFLGDKIQQDVLIFSEQIHFQYDYDPWHKVTSEVQKAADQLISDLGFMHLLQNDIFQK